MGTPAVVPSEEAIETLLRHFVAPLLPRRYVSAPTVDKQKQVGKQMQAVVALYNYYQIKQSPKLKFLNFISFCEVACISNSSLVHYMKFMCQGSGRLEDVHVQLSITEKMVKEACDICAALNASVDVFNLDGWPISKVAVFLVDAAKKKCLLKKGSIILGSWSLVEKDLEAPLEKLSGSRETNYAFKNKRIVDESDKLNNVEDFLQETAYSLVEQDMGITRSNLSILECHLSYSLTQLKSSTLLYIMNYKEPASSGVEVSVEDVISLHGLPIESSSCDMKPEITSVAEHYCLLPYIDIITEWTTRTTSQGCSLHPLEQKANLKGYSDDHLITANHQMGDKSDLSKGTCNGVFLHSMRQNVDMSGKFYDVDYTKSDHQNIGTCIDDLSSPRKNAKMDVDCSIAAPISAGHQIIVNSVQKKETSNDCIMHMRQNTDAHVSCVLELPIISNYEVIKKSDSSEEHIIGNFYNKSGSMNEAPRIISSKPSSKDFTGNDHLKKGDVCVWTEHGGDKLVKKKRNLEFDSGPSKLSFQQKAGSSYILDNSQNPSRDDSASKCQSFITNNLIHNGENTRNQCDLSPILDGMKDQVEYPVKKKCLGSSDRNTSESEVVHADFTNLDKALVHAHQKSNNHDPLFLALATNKDDLEVLVFQLLKKRRDELCCQQRLLEDFIAQFEMNIQTIISGENLNSQSELIMKACDFLHSSKVTKGGNSLEETQLQPHTIKRKRLSDADLSLRNPSQELDEICCRNHWILPTYSVLPSPEEGKFRALITAKGTDFEFTLRGDSKDGPTEARESAAACMLNKLTMTSHAHFH